MLVEDNVKLANYLKQSLQEIGYDVSIEKRDDRAVYRIIREQPCLVILDIMLPGMNGDQTCHTIRDEYLSITHLSSNNRQINTKP